MDKQNSQIALTVLLPVYNAGKFLPTAIKSMLLQTHGNFELLIIDDGSTDNSAEIIHSFADDRIRYVKIEHSGLSAALNRGLAEAKYDIVARMDADDISIPTRLEIQIARFSQMPSNSILSCNYVFYSEESGDIERIHHGGEGFQEHIFNPDRRYVWGLLENPVTHEDILRALPLHNVINHAGVMYNRHFILDNGGYALQRIEDYELWLRLKSKANFENISTPLMAVSYHKDSLSREKIGRSNAIIYNITRELFENTGLLFALGIHPEEVNGLRAWREYFYGDKSFARKYWVKSFAQINVDARSIVAYLATYLPPDLFTRFKESRYRFRLNYHRKKSSPEISFIESFIRKI